MIAVVQPHRYSRLRDLFEGFCTCFNDADAVLVTQLASLRTTGKVVNMNPEATYNLRPTGYYNVFSVDLQEYREPQAVDFEHEIVLITDLFSVSKRDTVWGIQASSKVKMGFDRLRDFSVIESEAEAIVSHLSHDGLLAR